MIARKVMLGGAAAAVIAIAGLSAAASGSSANLQTGQSFDADSLRIEHFIGRIEIRAAAAGAPIRVSVENAGGVASDPSVSAQVGAVYIDGGQEMRRLNCRYRNNTMSIGRRFDMHPIDDYPLLVISAPSDLALEMSRSAYQAEAGDLGSLELSVNHCGDFRAGDVSGQAEIGINGSGDVVLASIGEGAVFSINGSGDIEAGDIGGDARISINGSGDVAVDAIQGDLELGINGSGDVEAVSVASLDISINGSGDVEIDRMNGAFQARIGGSGDIAVRDGRAEPFIVDMHGSGDIRFGGTAVNVRVDEHGSGEVSVEALEGDVQWRRNGRTVLRVGSSD